MTALRTLSLGERIILLENSAEIRKLDAVLLGGEPSGQDRQSTHVSGEPLDGGIGGVDPFGEVQRPVANRGQVDYLDLVQKNIELLGKLERILKQFPHGVAPSVDGDTNVAGGTR